MDRTIYDIIRKDLIGNTMPYDDVTEVADYLSNYFGTECNLKDETIFVRPVSDNINNEKWYTFQVLIVFSSGTELLIAELESSYELNEGWSINELS